MFYRELAMKLLGGLAMPKYPREKGESIELPVYGDAEHNLVRHRRSRCQLGQR
jgi:hypothetical protein